MQPNGRTLVPEVALALKAPKQHTSDAACKPTSIRSGVLVLDVRRDAAPPQRARKVERLARGEQARLQREEFPEARAVELACLRDREGQVGCDGGRIPAWAPRLLVLRLRLVLFLLLNLAGEEGDSVVCRSL